MYIVHCMVHCMMDFLLSAAARLQPVFTLRRLGSLCLVPLLFAISGCELASFARVAYANANSSYQWSGDQRVTTVPFKLIDNHIILPVRVNGSEPLNFVLDSGAGATVIIDSRASRALNLVKDGELTVSGVGDGAGPVANLVPNTTLAIGDLSLAGQIAIYLPLDAIPFFNELDDVYFDGVIGAPFFERFIVEIDHDQQLIHLLEPLDTYRQAYEGGGWQSLPLEVAGGVPYATLQFQAVAGQSVAVKLLVDTGARAALMLTPATHSGLALPVEYFASTGQGLSGDVPGRVAMADALILAGQTLADVPVDYAIAGGESDNDSNGIVGNEVLRRFNQVYDYSRARLLLRPNQQFVTAMSADRSGLQIRPHGAGGFVRSIATGSAAQASSLEVGDIITSFDNVPVNLHSIRALKQALASASNSVELCWLSGGAQTCERIVLASRFRRDGAG
jgi:predicted aspartyl protease